MPGGLPCDPRVLAKWSPRRRLPSGIMAVGLFENVRDLERNLKLKTISTAGMEVILWPLWVSLRADLHLLLGEAAPARLPGAAIHHSPRHLGWGAPSSPN